MTRIRLAAVLALLSVCSASAQLLGSGHVLGNGTSAAAAPTDTSIINVMGQSGSGLGAGVATALTHAPNTSGGFVTSSASPAASGFYSLSTLGGGP